MFKGASRAIWQPTGSSRICSIIMVNFLKKQHQRGKSTPNPPATQEKPRP
jgi:hypothetical protein